MGKVLIVVEAFHYTQLNFARDALFKTGDFNKAFEALLPFLKQDGLNRQEKKAVNQLAGLIRMKQCRFNEASSYFFQVEDHYMTGYCKLLMGDFQSIQQYWHPLIKDRINH